MSETFRIADVSDVPPGTAKELIAGGRVVALFNVDGAFYALDGICPHAGGPLAEGSVSGSVVTCPWHGWPFDVTSGRHCLNENIQHTTFAVTVEGDDVLVEIDD